MSVEFFESEGRHFASLGIDGTKRNAYAERVESVIFPGEAAIVFYKELEPGGPWDHAIVISERTVREALAGLQSKPITTLTEDEN